jgi:hypothetical protein
MHRRRRAGGFGCAQGGLARSRGALVQQLERVHGRLGQVLAQVGARLVGQSPAHGMHHVGGISFGQAGGFGGHRPQPGQASHGQGHGLGG